jgi:hypothetical protein
MSAEIHDFAESLRASHEQADNPLWEEVYRRAFHNLKSMVCVRDDGWAQRGGIDRVLVLSSGKTLNVDEKVRSKDYGDILLEYWSDYDRRIPGWVQKDLACDFIAYAVIPAQRCYLLPFTALRAAWRANGRQWVDKYATARAQNRGYCTHSVAVPTPVLLGALQDAMTVSWSQSEAA